MARTKAMHTLKQLHNAFRAIPMAEFMRLSRQGRAAYGALFDEFTELFEEVDEEGVTLAAPGEGRRLPRSYPPMSMAPPVSLSTAPAAPVHEAVVFRKVRPLEQHQEVKPWARALNLLGLDEQQAQEALMAQRDLWARGEAYRIMRDVGFQFEPTEQPLLQPNVGQDLHIS